MLELPESYTIAKQIEEHLTGKIISYIEVLKGGLHHAVEQKFAE